MAPGVGGRRVEAQCGSGRGHDRADSYRGWITIADRVGEGVHVAPVVTLCGLVVLGARSSPWAGTRVPPRVWTSAGTVVGARAVVIRDLPDNIVAYGQLARIIRLRPLPVA